MKEYIVKNDIVEITLDNDKKVKVSKKWVDNSIKALKTDIEDVLLMYLEDNDYLVNESQLELDTKAKANKIKVNAKSTTEKKKVKRERKSNPVKENIISTLAETLRGIAEDVNIENIGKIITFKIDNREFKLDLVEKRQPKVK